jgi:two-component system KDP operon response regulator KdpE
MNDPAHILIADDVVELRQVLRFHLEHAGSAVSEAGTGREAIDEVARDCPDVLVLDVTMPDMDGWAVLDHLRREGAHRPRVAVLTAHADESVEILARNAGADVYLAKPLAASELTAAVRLHGRPCPHAVLADQGEQRLSD